eukprot:308697-Lingulodinium_polyedra.AAC.1
MTAATRRILARGMFPAPSPPPPKSSGGRPQRVYPASLMEPISTLPMSTWRAVSESVLPGT